MARHLAIAALGAALALAVIVHYRHTQTGGGLVAPKEVRGSPGGLMTPDTSSQFVNKHSFGQARVLTHVTELTAGERDFGRF